MRRLIDSDDFERHILDLWKNNEEIDKILNSTMDGDNPFFKEGFKFGLIWAALNTSQVYPYFLKEAKDS